MKLKNNFFYTLRENVKDEDSISGNLLVKGGFIKKTSAGIYMFMPLGYRVLKKLENLIREEMNRTGAIEMQMPSLIASEYYEKSGRMENFGSSVYNLKDRTGKKIVLGPTHEELFVVAAKSMVKSYKNLPFNLYQFQNKFRDEPRARFGLIRVKEFCMKDAYSFDLNEEGLTNSYNKMDRAYHNIFNRLGLNYRVVKADTGIMGGLLSEEFQAITPIGEDTIVYCEKCDYSSNIEIASFKLENIDKKSTLSNNFFKVYTPNAKTINEVCHFMKKDIFDFVKTLIYVVDNEIIAVCVKGNYEVSEVKLQKLLQAKEIRLAEVDEISSIVNAQVGFIGPIGLKCKIVIDNEILNMENFITGANENDYHLQNVNINDFNYNYVGDIRKVTDQDLCPCCGSKLKLTKGIEIGNIFKLGTKYSDNLGLTYLDNENKQNKVWMGSYGIGLGRCVAACIEQKSDEKGIIWPKEIAPYKVAIIIISSKDENQITKANYLYSELIKSNIDVIYDDRDERPGIKFNDMDLIGIPYRIVVGKKINENIVEIKARENDNIIELTVDKAIEYIINI